MIMEHYRNICQKPRSFKTRCYVPVAAQRRQFYTHQKPGEPLSPLLGAIALIPLDQDNVYNVDKHVRYKSKEKDAYCLLNFNMSCYNYNINYLLNKE